MRDRKEYLKSYMKKYYKKNKIRLNELNKVRRKTNGHKDRYNIYYKKYYRKNKLEICRQNRDRRKSDVYLIKQNQRRKIGTSKYISGITDFLTTLYHFKREVLDESPQFSR